MSTICVFIIFFFSSRRRHTRCALVTGVQTCALPLVPTDRSIFIRNAVQLFFGQFLHKLGLVGKALRSLAEQVHRDRPALRLRSEEHTSELQSLMRISYAVFCLKKKKKYKHNQNT